LAVRNSSLRLVVLLLLVCFEHLEYFDYAAASGRKHQTECGTGELPGTGALKTRAAQRRVGGRSLV
jgi:hypothetical protein